MEDLQLTLKIKLLPSEKQREQLLETIKLFNLYCNKVSPWVYENKIKSKISLQKAFYHDLIQDNPLGSQLLIKTFQKTSASYKDFKTERTYDELGAIDYDKRVMSTKVNHYISLKVLGDRIKIPYASTLQIQKVLETEVYGQSKLYYDKYSNNFYLLLNYKPEIKPQRKTNQRLGIDRGIKNVIATSTGELYSSKDIKKRIDKYQKHKGELQKIKSSSSRRRLKKIGRKHSKFIKNENHTLAKKIVNQAKALNAKIILEDLSGIKATVSLNKRQSKTFRKGLQNWSYYQLEQYIIYKAQIQGIPVEHILPYYTSQECPKCGHINSDNRNSEEFLCKRCGHKNHADINGAEIIEKRSYIPQDKKLFSKTVKIIEARLQEMYKEVGLKSISL